MSDDRRTVRGSVARRGVTSNLVEQKFPFELRGRKSPKTWTEGHFPPPEPSFKQTNGRSETGTTSLDPDPEAGGAGADLRKCRILVVEDDFVLAAELGRALLDAGATVLGPVGQEEQALALIAAEAPTCALLDINLGEGMQYTVADALGAKSVPFMFVTGYDDVMIPERFRDIGRIRKPMGVRLAMCAAALMCRSPA
jgi:CheY-like chemotaxis protein